MDIPLRDSLHKQVALVTGASQGIGKEIASQLSDYGATVYGASRAPDTVSDSVRPVALDVRDEADIGNAMDLIRRDHEQLDILVNNAAIGGPDGPIGEGTTGGIERTLATNLRGPILTVKHALPLLLEGEGSRIINVSSTGGQLSGDADRWRGAYCVSKAGLNGLTVQLDASYNDRGILVNAASPGWAQTSIGGPDAPRTPHEGAETPVWLARFDTNSPSGKFWEDKEPIPW